MADYQSTVDSIRAMLAAGDRGAEMATALAVSYAAICREANERLRRCVDYLHRGLRTEAVQLAECQPNLVELVAALDLRERSSWDELCQSLNISRPPRLMLESAQELNEAYAAHQSLAPLLARHRVLALARGPLALRLAVMRQIAERDKNTPLWEDDLKGFEAARVREMRNEADAAVRAADTQRLSQLAAELLNSTWHVDIPPDLRQTLESVARSARLQEAIASWQSLLPDIQTMFSAQSYDGCAELMNRWRAIGEGAQVDPPAELAEQIKPIDEWVAREGRERRRQEEFALICDQLETAVRADAPRRVLEDLHRKAVRFDMPIPDWLQKRYARQMRSHELAGRRRMRITVAIVAALVLLLAGGGGWIYYHSAKEAVVNGWASAIDGRLGAGDPEGAEKLWQVMVRDNQKLGDELRLVKIRLELDAALGQWRSRQEQLGAEIDAAKAAARGEATETQLRILDEHLQKADALKRTEGDRQELAILTAKRDAMERQIARVRDAAFVKDLKVLDEQVGQLSESELQADPEAFGRKVLGIEATARLLRERPGISSYTMAELTPCIDRLKGWRARYTALVAELDKTDRRRQLLREVRRSTVSSPVLAAALKAAADGLPDSDRKRDFTAAIGEAPLWADLEQWGQLVNSWAGNLMPDAAQLAERPAAVADYLKKHPNSPFRQQIAGYQAFLARAQEASAPTGLWRTKLGELMKRPLLANMSCIKTKEGKVYYLVGDGEFKDISPRVQFTAVLSLDGARTSTISLSIDELNGRVAPSPQTLMVAAILKRLNGFRAEEWDMLAPDIVQLIIDGKDVDPILKVIVLQEVVRMAQEQKASWGLDDLWAGYAKALAEVGAEQSGWINPDDADAPAVRVKAQQALDKLKSLGSAHDMASKAREASLAPLRFAPVATGVATREGGQWQIDSADALTDGLQAVVLAPTSAGDGRELQLAGTVKAGKVDCDRTTLDRVAEGCMVFLRQPIRK